MTTEKRYLALSDDQLYLNVAGATLSISTVNEAFKDGNFWVIAVCISIYGYYVSNDISYLEVYEL